MRDVRRHHRDRTAAADLQECALAGGVELQNGGAELESLRPLGPSAARVPAVHRADGRALGRIPRRLDGRNLAGREFEQAAQFRLERLWSEIGTDAHWLSRIVTAMRPGTAAGDVESLDSSW